MKKRKIRKLKEKWITETKCRSKGKRVIPYALSCAITFWASCLGYLPFFL
jgi:hypothetical protein